MEGYAKLSPADRAHLMRDLGFSDSLPVQYLGWLRAIASGQLGKSFFRGDTVADLILRRGPISAEIAFLALIISWLVGLPVGILSAIRPNGWADAAARSICRPLHRRAGLLARHAHRPGIALLVRLQDPNRHRPALGEPVAEFPDHPGPGGGPWPRPGRVHRADVALVPARGDPRGLRAHRPRQGRCGAGRGDAPRPAQRAPAR